MVVLGAFFLGQPPVAWRFGWPPLLYATVHPRDGWRGARWIRWAQWPLLLLRAWWTLMARRCQVILVVFPDEVFLLAGYVLARLTGLPLYAYFHNTYLENRPNNRLARFLQPRVFAMAGHVFVMSEGMDRLYKKNYPNLRCSPLVHSFNGPLPDPTDVISTPVHQPLRLVMFGNVNASNADAASRLAQLVQLTPETHLTIFTGTSRSFLKELGFTGNRMAIETVPGDVLLRRVSQADIILLPHGFTGPIAAEEIATIFPTRTIEALVSRRPILAHLPATCFLAQFLHRHQCALLVDEPDLKALTRALEQLRQDGSLRVRLVRHALIAARQFHAPTVAAHLREVLQNGAKRFAAAERKAISR
jgi:hypothetical protein